MRNSSDLKPQLLSYHIAENVLAFSTQRNNGFSLGTYASFNITHYCGDNFDHVQKNRRLLCEELGITESHLIIPHQVHGTNVLNIDAEILQSSPEKRNEALSNIDAVITNCRNTCIGVSTADCVPILLYDSNHHVIAAIHGGWRGIVKNIITRTLHSMQSTYGTEAKDIQAVIGPSISETAFEVGDDVYEIFQKNGWNMNSIARRYPCPSGEKWHIDLWVACYIQLEQEGVPLDHIQISGICTVQSPEHFFSARRDGIKSGRIFSGILMK